MQRLSLRCTPWRGAAVDRRRRPGESPTPREGARAAAVPEARDVLRRCQGQKPLCLGVAGGGATCCYMTGCGVRCGGTASPCVTQGPAVARLDGTDEASRCACGVPRLRYRGGVVGRVSPCPAPACGGSWLPMARGGWLLPLVGGGPGVLTIRPERYRARALLAPDPWRREHRPETLRLGQSPSPHAPDASRKVSRFSWLWRWWTCPSQWLSQPVPAREAWGCPGY